MPNLTVWSGETESYSTTYTIYIDDLPIVTRKINQMEKFWPDYSALKEDFGAEIEPVWNPKTGRNDGGWAGAEALERRGYLAAWDRFKYIASDVEAVVRAHISDFLGIQEVNDILEKWRRNASGWHAQRRTELIQEALSDLRRRLTFARVLQALIREFVPITDVKVILEVFTANKNEGDAQALVEMARMALRGSLPGNKAGFQFLKLAPAFEAEMRKWIHRYDNRTFFAIPLDRNQKLLNAVRNALGKLNQNERSVIVTQKDTIRPFVRRLIELEFPKVMVLSWKELLTHLRANLTRQIDYTE